MEFAAVGMGPNGFDTASPIGQERG
jgi:hypothetical protein